MSSTPRRLVPPLWPERQADWLAALRPDPTLRPPAPHVLAHEAAVLSAAVAGGHQPWPPTDIRHEAVTQGVAGPPAPWPFDDNGLVGFHQLPSVRQFAATLRTHTTRLFGAPHEELVEQGLHQAFHLAQWRRYGRAAYVLEPATYTLLVHTDLPRWPVHQLRVPFPSFYLVLPAGAFSFDVRGDATPQPVEGLFVAFSPALAPASTPRELAVFVTGRSANGDTANDNVAFVSALLDPALTMPDVRFPHVESVIRVGRHALAHDLPHVVLGFLLYLMGAHPVLEAIPAPSRPEAARGHMSPKAARRMARRTGLAVCLVHPPAGAVAPAPGAPGVGAPLDHAVWVRGHMRAVPTGPGRQQRIVRWIAPHQRGPDFAETLSRSAQAVTPARRRPARPRSSDAAPRPVPPAAPPDAGD